MSFVRRNANHATAAGAAGPFVSRRTSERIQNWLATMVRFSCQAAAFLLAATAVPCAESFTNNDMRSRATLRWRQTAQRLPAPPSVSDDSTILFAIPTAEESAKALSDYMAKSHEDKLRAVKDAESKKTAEIQALREEVAALKAGKGQIVQSTSPMATMPEGSKEELLAKLQSYQKFMADYIVKAQEQKLAAVRAAEAATAKKYEEKLLLLGGAAAAPAAPAIAAAATPTLFAERNAKISAAAKAGKSRWGDAEVQRVAAGVVPPPATSQVAPAVPAAAAAIVVPAAEVVEAADHGLRADGGVGGPSLAERLSSGANGAIAPASAASTSLYDKRNAMVSAAGKAGKSRWGEQEVQKSIQLTGNALPSAAPKVQIAASLEVEAADHGLRADGGVDGPSLAERVNLGASLLGK